MNSSGAEIEAALADLQRSKERWAALEIGARLEILDEIVADMLGVAERWIAASVDAKGLRPRSYGEGEEWLYLAVVFRLLRLLRSSLAEIRAEGRPRLPRLARRPDGQVTATVFPLALWERLFFAGVEAEIWLEPGVSTEQAIAAQAAFYRRRGRQGRVALVLGAGNVSALVPADLLYKLFVEGAVVVLKPNPVNGYLGPLIEEGFRALVRRGFLRLVHGGAEEGARLCQHPAVDEIHMTGSDRTFEAIVFGPGEEGARRKAERTPLVTKPFSAELGNVSPVIVVPGPWSAGDVRAQAGRIASWLVNNAGFNCLTPRVLIQSRGWSEREALLRAIGHVLETIETRRAYYPGARERHAEFVAAHPRAEQHGRPGAGDLPWTLIPDVDPARADDICFRKEAFCALMAETALEAASVPEFLERATAFANETLWGTLTATIVVHPRSLDDPQIAAAVDRAVARLRYGTVVVNNYGGLAYYLGSTSWGAFPGHAPHDVQSGIGVVNNALMLGQVQKSVLRCPFRQVPDPSAVTARSFHEFGRSLAMFEADPSLKRAPGVLMRALGL
jgi:acyl-CoA reductase-like NAD-dependent aldehyde dehydrogenase